MADKKISALTSATTPLAGTEVLPIVQSGSTVKVAVSDLTAGRAVATGALTVTGAISANTTLGVTGATTLSSTLSLGGTVSGGGNQINNVIIGTTTPLAGSFTTLTTSSTVTINGGTANGVAYLDASKVLTTGSTLVFNGTNLGVGVTPNAWLSLTGLQTVGGGSLTSNTNSTFIGVNWYYDGANKYIANGFASRYILENGSHQWYSAPNNTSGAGAALTFTQAMTLDASGNLGVGVAPSTSNTAGASFVPGTSTVASMTGSNGSGQLLLGNNGNGSNLATNDSCGMIAFKGRFNSTFAGGNDIASIIGTYTGNGTTRSGAIRFLTLNLGTETEAARIDSSGNLGIGTSSIPAGFKLYASGGSMLLDNNTVFRQKDSAGNNTLIFALSSSNNLEFGSGSHSGGLTITTGNSNITFTTNSAERARFNSTGALVFAGGTTTADGIGITFPATQSASSDANTLDDYEEGTFDVTVTMGTSGTCTLNAAYNKMRYTKIGRMVTIQGQVLVNSVSSPVGEMQMSLPFAIGASDEGSNLSGCVPRLYNVDVPATGLYPYVFVQNSNAFMVVEFVTDNGVTINHVPAAGNYFLINFSYFTA